MRLAGDRRRRGPLWSSSCGVSEELLVFGDACYCLFCGNDDAAASVAAPAAEDDDVLVPYCASVSVLSGFLDIVEAFCIEVF